MFLQVEVRAKDGDYLLFLRRWEYSKLPLQSSHFWSQIFSIVCKLRVAKMCRDNADDFVLANQASQNFFFMDELLVSVDTKEEAIILKTDFTVMLARGGFKLTNEIGHEFRRRG